MTGTSRLPPSAAQPARELRAVAYLERLRDTGRGDLQAVHAGADFLADRGPSTLSRVANLALLTGVAGTMVALFEVARDLQARLGAGQTLGPEVLASVLSSSFSAFSVTIVGVSLAAIALTLAHRSRARLEAARGALLVAVEEKAEEILDARAESGLDSGELERAILRLEKGLLEGLSPLAQLGKSLKANQTATTQLARVLERTDGVEQAVVGLAEAAEGLRATAASLPGAYVDHANQARAVLDSYREHAAAGFEGVRQSVADIAGALEHVKRNLSEFYERALEDRDRAMMDALQSNLNLVQSAMRSAAEATRAQTAAHESAIAAFVAGAQQVERSQRAAMEAAAAAARHEIDGLGLGTAAAASAISDLAASLETTCVRMVSIADALAVVAERQAARSDDDPTWAVRTAGGATTAFSWTKALAAAAAGAALAGFALWFFTARTAPKSDTPSPVSTAPPDLVWTAPGQAAGWVVQGQSEVVARGRATSNGRWWLTSVGDGFAVLRAADGRHLARWTHAASPTLRKLPAVTLDQLAEVRWGSANGDEARLSACAGLANTLVGQKCEVRAPALELVAPAASATSPPLAACVLATIGAAADGSCPPTNKLIHTVLQAIGDAGASAARPRVAALGCAWLRFPAAAATLRGSELPEPLRHVAQQHVFHCRHADDAAAELARHCTSSANDPEACAAVGVAPPSLHRRTDRDGASPADNGAPPPPDAPGRERARLIPPSKEPGRAETDPNRAQD